MQHKSELTILIWQENNLFVARAVEIEIASQGYTKEEAINNLKEAIELYFEDSSKNITIPTISNVSVEKVPFKYA